MLNFLSHFDFVQISAYNFLSVNQFEIIQMEFENCTIK